MSFMLTNSDSRIAAFEVWKKICLFLQFSVSTNTYCIFGEYIKRNALDALLPVHVIPMKDKTY